MLLDVPRNFRPLGLNYIKICPGVDLPAWFIEGIKQIDKRFHFIFHPYRVTYDNFMNQYSGSLEDPRFTISDYGGQEIWGYPLTTGTGAPIEENRWHIWRISYEAGAWCHIIDIKVNHFIYLDTILERLWLQKHITEKYGLLAWMSFIRQERELKEQRELGELDDKFSTVQNENKWLMKRAADNFASGHSAPTKPQKEQILSYPRQSNRSRITRDLTGNDKESGIWLPDDWKK